MFLVTTKTICEYLQKMQQQSHIYHEAQWSFQVVTALTTSVDRFVDIG